MSREVPIGTASSHIVLSVGFILTGTVTTIIGPLLPALALRWSLSDARAGQFFVAQFAGSTVGALTSDHVARRIGTKPALLLGFSMIALGVAGLSLASTTLALLGVLVYGLGLGFTVPAINLTIADLRRDASASALNISNMLWTLGALASPLLVSSALRSGHLQVMLLGLATCAVVIAVALAATPIPPISYEIPSTPASAHETKAPRANSTWLLFAFVFFLYVGLENSVAGWAAAYAQRTGIAHTIAAAALVPAAFWSALLAGRALFSVLMLRTMPPRIAASLGMVLALLGCVILLVAGGVLLAGGPVLMIAGVSFAGLGLAPVFPNAIAQAKSTLRGRNIAPLFACAGAGGAVVPYLVGVASSRTLELSSGIRFALLVCCVLTALQVRLSRLERAA
jgi:fucose permease